MGLHSDVSRQEHALCAALPHRPSRHRLCGEALSPLILSMSAYNMTGTRNWPQTSVECRALAVLAQHQLQHSQLTWSDMVSCAPCSCLCWGSTAAAGRSALATSQQQWRKSQMWCARHAWPSHFSCIYGLSHCSSLAAPYLNETCMSWSLLGRCFIQEQYAEYLLEALNREGVVKPSARRSCNSILADVAWGSLFWCLLCPTVPQMGWLMGWRVSKAWWVDILLQGNVVFVRFYEAEGSGMDRRTPPPADKYKKLKASADACVDIPTIMASLPVAIKNAAKQSRSDVWAAVAARLL